jgi:D-alanyl-D-alanine carboxypeptidase (penicillin-binding protein 5/6)
MGGSQVYLKEGETLTLEELLKAVMIHSANDATAAVAEYIAGNTDAFVDLMNERAEQLGLKETHYTSVHGLPAAAGQKDDEMSAYDLAMLGRELSSIPRRRNGPPLFKSPFAMDSSLLSTPITCCDNIPALTVLRRAFTIEPGFV